MNIKDIAKKYEIDRYAFNNFLGFKKLEYKDGRKGREVDDNLVEDYVKQFKEFMEEVEERKKERESKLEDVKSKDSMNMTVYKTLYANWEYDKYITTTDSFANGEIEEYLGIVTGTDIYLVGGVFGGGLINQEGLVNTALYNAKNNLMKKVLHLGGNAVIGTTLTMTSPGNNNNIILTLSGTAVKVKF